MDHEAGVSDVSLSCSSGLSRKRKRPDEEDILLREGPLTGPPIENEYEELDDEDQVDEDHTNNLGRLQYEQLRLAEEKATLRRYDDIKVTPFNLDEELEEGKFDKAGNFVFEKKKDGGSDEEDDNWADSVNWEEVEKKEREREIQESASSSSHSKPCPPKTNRDNGKPTVIEKIDKLGCYKEMLRLMRPDETVKRTIQRLGQSAPKKRPFNKNAKRKNDDTNMSICASSLEEDRRKLDRMIELAHLRLEDGDVDIYQKSYEDLEEAIN